MLHGEHAQVGGSDDSQVNIAFRIKSDIPEAQAHGEVRRCCRGVIRADLSFQVFDPFNVWDGNQIVREKDFETHDHGDIGAAHFRLNDRRASARHDLQFSGKE